MKSILFFLLSLCFGGTPLFAQSIIYVNHAATGSNTGTSWNNAYVNLQSALQIATPGDQIWVAQGTYTPAASARDSPFVIPDSVQVYGGFAGFEPSNFDLKLRNFEDYQTILSGDLQNTPGILTDDSYHVVFTQAVSPETIVDGFTITKGNADQTTGPNSTGGGWLNYGRLRSNPTLRNIHFFENRAIHGGAMYNNGSGGEASPSLENCEFTYNSATNNAGAVYNNGNSSGKAHGSFVNCRFEYNTANYGGAAYNSAFTSGNSSPSYLNCIFRTNSANINGGAIHNNGLGGFTSAIITNCTFFQNTAVTNGGALFNNGNNGISSPQISNCIFWENSAGGVLQSLYNATATPTLTFSIVQENACPGIDTKCNSILFAQDPIFKNAPGGDFQLLATSPAMNAGINDSTSTSTDLAGDLRIVDGTVEMGAYEFQENRTLFYVNDDATGNNTGESWVNAFTDLQRALHLTTPSDSVWVAAGVYKPTTGSNRDISFEIPDSVQVYGSFEGDEPCDFNVLFRDFTINPTVLSGDIGVLNDSTDNSHHVVFTKHVSDQTIIDGFTITQGNAIGSTYNGGSAIGGGWLNDGSGQNNSSLPSLRNLKFTSNTADYGGAMNNFGRLEGNASPTYTECSFENNVADYYGGALYNSAMDGNSSPDFLNCTFDKNRSKLYGGAVYSIANGGTANPTFTNCSFSGNSSNFGGAISNLLGNGTFLLQLTNCSFSGNSAITSGGAFYNQSINSNMLSVEAVNCIFWNNPANGVNESFASINNNAQVTASYSLMQESACPPNTSCSNVLFNQDPLFADTVSADLRLLSGSPAINAGNDAANTSSSDLDRNLRKTGTIDLGAYEFQGNRTLFYVNDDAIGNNTGESWANAFTDLQKALHLTTPSDSVWVAAGTYKPTNNLNRNVSFDIPDSVKVYGSFEGTETPDFNLNLRNPELHKTILSGDIGIPGGSLDNSYHVVKTLNVSEQTLVDGFIITLGNANGTGDVGNVSNGGGWLNKSFGANKMSNPMLRNLLFIDNTANTGGGIFNQGTDSGIASPSITNCVFFRNTALYYGGAMFNSGTYSGKSKPILTNCSFNKNSSNAIKSGGGLYNAANNGGSVNPVISNCIFWGNKANGNISSVVNISANPTLSYSLLEEASCPGTGSSCIMGMIYTQDPLFVDTYSGNLRLLAGSPAINAGDNSPVSYSTDFEGNYRFVGNQTDMGAYEFQGSETHLYVNQNGNGDNTGLDWLNAFTDLQDALQLANAGDSIWVAKGTYKPTSTSDKTISFQIPDSVKVYGGFEGTEPGNYDLDSRDLINNETILSGDIGSIGDSTDNSYHVVYTQNVSQQTIFDGFTIREGMALGSGDWKIGGGWLNSGYGTGKVSNPTISNCQFLNNSAVTGGGIYNVGNGGTGNPTIIHCFFANNSATSSGGAIFNYAINGQSSPLLINCVFLRNSSVNQGGGIYNLGINSTTSTVITNCTFTQNSALTGGALYNFKNSGVSKPVISNCLFWDNSANTGLSVYNSGALPTFSYSMVEEASCPDVGSTCGSGMIYATDPQFIDAVNGNLALKCNSPAIDTGTPSGAPAEDINNFTRTGNPDMGAYEYGYAYISYPIPSGSNLQISGTDLIDANSQIINTSDVSYQAVKAVQLLPGFLVQPINGEETVFEASIGGACP